MFFLMNKKKRQGCWPQKSELGMHQNGHFQQKSMKNQKNPEINPLTGRKKNPYFLVSVLCSSHCEVQATLPMPTPPEGMKVGKDKGKLHPC